MDDNKPIKKKEYISFGMMVQEPASPAQPSVPQRVPAAPVANTSANAGYQVDAPPEISDYSNQHTLGSSALNHHVHVTEPNLVAGLSNLSLLPPRTYQEAVIVPPQAVPALQIDLVENTFADMVADSPGQREVPLVVLDCANIGWSFGIDSFHAKGVEIAISHFKSMQIEVQAFIPASYLRAKPRQLNAAGPPLRGNAMMVTDDVELLMSLLHQGLLTTVPSGDSDDAYILNYARDNNGFVVSNDLFHDHLRSLTVESVRRSMQVWLHDHRCGYTFTGRQEFVFNPSSELRTIVYQYHWRINQKQQSVSSASTQSAQSSFIAQPSSSGGGDDNRRSIYAANQELPFRFYQLTPEGPLLYNSVLRPGHLRTAIQAVTAAIGELCVLPGCPVPAYHQLQQALSIGVTAVHDGSVAGVMEVDSLREELKGLLLARAGLLEKVGMRAEGRRDVEYVLSVVDKDCAAARAMLARLTSSS